MTDYTAEIARIRTLIANGTTSVRHGDVEARYGSFKDLLEALRYFESQAATGESVRASFASFDRGDC